MFLFFDTETTGVPKNYKASVYDLDNWPRMVQIAWAKYDENGKLLDEHASIIKPEDFVIPAKAVSVHGITTEMAHEKGENLKEILDKFSNELSENNFLIAHNMKFDEKIVGAEFLRKNVAHKLEDIHKLCTMLSSVEYCALPGPYGYKWPKLDELHVKLFGESFEGAHDALADVKACARCFFELCNRGVMNF